MINHTQGPWHLMETEPGIDAEIDVFVTTPRWAGGTGLIARVMNADDALLIAAAPDLLEALQNMVEAHRSGKLFASTINNAVDAITKATGESK
jgi:hypothetical protein